MITVRSLRDKPENTGAETIRCPACDRKLMEIRGEFRGISTRCPRCGNWADIVENRVSRGATKQVWTCGY